MQLHKYFRQLLPPCIATVCAVVCGPTPAAESSELWVEPPPRCWNGTVCLEPVGDPQSLDADCMRDDYLASVDPPSQWSELLDQATVWQMGNINVLKTPPGLFQCMPHQPLTDEELNQLVSATIAAGVEIGFEVGGFSLGGTPVNPTSPPDGLGEAGANSLIGLLDRWYTVPGARVDQIAADNPIGRALKKMASWGATDFISLSGLIRELADFYEIMHAEDPSLRLGLIEGHSGWVVTDDAGVTYEPAGGLLQPPMEFAEFLDQLVAELANRDGGVGVPLDFYLSDVGPHVPDADEGVPHDGNWDMHRLVQVERVIKRAGLKHALFIHPGHWGKVEKQGTTGIGIYPTIEFGDRIVYDLVLRYIEEFRAAGGDPDAIVPANWHEWPHLVGPSDTPFTWMNGTRELVRVDNMIKDRIIVKYLVDDFFVDSEGSLWDDPNAAWQVADGVLSQGSGSGYTTMELIGEVMGDLVVRTSLKLGPAGNGWAGVHFRKDQPGHKAWHSGYTVQMRPTGKVVLSKPGVTLASEHTGLDVLAEAVDLRIEAIGNRIQVSVNSEVFIELVDTDPDPGPSYASGYLSFDTASMAAEYDDFAVSRYPFAAGSFSDDFSGGTLDGWTATSGDWSLDNDQLLQWSATGVAQIAHDGDYTSLRATVDVKLGAGTGWAGIFFRKNDPTKSPNKDGYHVFIRPSGKVTLHKAGGALVTVTTPVDTSDFVTLKVVAEEHRFSVSLNGHEFINWWDVDDTFVSGTFGLVSSERRAWFDNVAVEKLSE